MDWLTLKKESGRFGRSPLATVYVSSPDESIVVSARGQGSGASYDRGEAARLPLSAPRDQMGQAVLEALAQFSTKNLDLRSRTLDDRGAFLASGLKSERRFEERYTWLGVEFLVNGLIVLEAQVMSNSALSVRSVAGASEVDSRIGSKFFRSTKPWLS